MTSFQISYTIKKKTQQFQYLEYSYTQEANTFLWQCP